jgi:hypothetical protein
MSRRRPVRRVLLLVAAVAFLPGLAGPFCAALVWLAVITVGLVWAFRAGRRSSGGGPVTAPGPAPRPSRPRRAPAGPAARRKRLLRRLAVLLLIR